MTDEFLHYSLATRVMETRLEPGRAHGFESTSTIRQFLYALSLASATKCHSAERHTMIQVVQLTDGPISAVQELSRYSNTPSSLYSSSRAYIGVPVYQTTGVRASPSQQYLQGLKP